MELKMQFSLSKNHYEQLQVKVCFGDKYIGRNLDHEVVIEDSVNVENAWVLARKTGFYFESYDPECRNVYLEDTYVIYYIHNGKYYYLNIIPTKNQGVEFKIVQGTQNYNRHTICLQSDGTYKSYTPINTKIWVKI
jgi:hypothetical protein